MDASGKIKEFERLAGEVRLLFHHLRAAAEVIHAGDPEITAAHRGVLESLYVGGTQTGPAMARARPVARQHIQVLVNDLLALGLVEAQPNPAHRRSPLIALTSAGRKRFEAMRRREQAALGAVSFPLSRARMIEAADALAVIRAALARDVLGDAEHGDG